jgi:hypothetical protein
MIARQRRCSNRPRFAVVVSGFTREDGAVILAIAGQGRHQAQLSRVRSLVSPHGGPDSSQHGMCTRMDMMYRVYLIDKSDNYYRVYCRDTKDSSIRTRSENLEQRSPASAWRTRLAIRSQRRGGSPR